MADSLYKEMTPREQGIVETTLRDFSNMTSNRSVFNSHYEDVAALILPSYVNTFYYGAMNTPGMRKTERQIDSTGMMALSRFAAICDSLLTPANLMWHGLEADDEYVMKDRATKLWFEEVTKILFKVRYSPHANFSGQNQAVYTSLGAFGSGVMFIDQFYDIHKGRPGLRYKALPLGDVYLRFNHQGLCDGFIRILRYTARQCLQVKAWEGKLPEMIRVAAEKGSMQVFTILQDVAPRTEYDPQMLGPEGKPFYSYYVSVDGKCLLEEGGYNSLPISATRYQQAPGEDYGRGPAMDVLPALKTLNAEKAVFLKQGHRAADPVLLTHDDGMLNLSLRPGALNKGGVSAKGERLVDILPSGEIQVTLEMMQEEASLIKDAFLVSLFELANETKRLSATEVIERMNEKGILIAPVVGRQTAEYLGPTIDRELDLLSMLKVLPPQPPRLREANGLYSVRYTGPLIKSMGAAAAAGFVRTVEGVKELVNITGDVSLLDPFDFDAAIPEIADSQQVPTRWMADDTKIAAKREGRAQQAAEQQKINAAPAAAAMIKANAAAVKAGVQPAARDLAPSNAAPGLGG